MKMSEKDVEILVKLCKVFIGLSDDKKEYILGLADGITLSSGVKAKEPVIQG